LYFLVWPGTDTSFSPHLCSCPLPKAWVFMLWSVLWWWWCLWVAAW
jgi:hypothetical protein